MWLTKDPSYPEPTPINAEAERGSYIFFNHQTWQRARVSKRLFTLCEMAIDMPRNSRSLSCNTMHWTTISQCGRVGEWLDLFGR